MQCRQGGGAVVDADVKLEPRESLWREGVGRGESQVGVGVEWQKELVGMEHHPSVDGVDGGVGCVTDYGVAECEAVESNLVAAAGAWDDADLGDGLAVVAAVAEEEERGGGRAGVLAPVLGRERPDEVAVAAHHFEVVFGVLANRCPALEDGIADGADDEGEVLLLGATLLEEEGGCRRRLPRDGVEHDARGRVVELVAMAQLTCDLGQHALQDVRRVRLVGLLAVPAAVDPHVRRLVDGDVALAAMDELERVHRRRSPPTATDRRVPTAAPGAARHPTLRRGLIWLILF
mmetsp:Transcript_2675/g.8389  ORF Transcript_2675/g.8389 Transcript_2675/m.8389 type:complete len:290 (+) Transcript_2675:245-1114(+)